MNSHTVAHSSRVCFWNVGSMIGYSLHCNAQNALAQLQNFYINESENVIEEELLKNIASDAEVTMNSREGYVTIDTDEEYEIPVTDGLTGESHHFHDVPRSNH